MVKFIANLWSNSSKIHNEISVNLESNINRIYLISAEFII